MKEAVNRVPEGYTISKFTDTKVDTYFVLHNESGKYLWSDGDCGRGLYESKGDFYSKYYTFQEALDSIYYYAPELMAAERRLSNGRPDLGFPWVTEHTIEIQFGTQRLEVDFAKNYRIDPSRDAASHWRMICLAVYESGFMIGLDTQSRRIRSALGIEG